MPIVTIQITREGTPSGFESLTATEKAALIKGASQLLLDVLNKPLEATFVVIDEIDPSNWAGEDFLFWSIARSSQLSISIHTESPNGIRP